MEKKPKKKEAPYAFARVSKKERGEVEALGAERGYRGSAKEAKEAKDSGRGTITGKTPEEQAQRNIDVKIATENINNPPAPEGALNQPEGTGTVTVLPPPKTAEPAAIDTEIITTIDESGFERQIERPIGTLDKMNAAYARREGRVPFDELPAYQQFLAGIAVTGASPQTLTSGGKLLNNLGDPLTKFMTTTLGKYVTGITTFAGIMTWLASDNIIGSMSIYTRDLAEDVTFGKLSKEEALEKINEGDAFVEDGRNFIKTATILNPILWPFRKIIMANADAAQLAIDENKERILRA